MEWANPFLPFDGIDGSDEESDTESLAEADVVILTAPQEEDRPTAPHGVVEAIIPALAQYNDQSSGASLFGDDGTDSDEDRAAGNNTDDIVVDMSSPNSPP